MGKKSINTMQLAKLLSMSPTGRDLKLSHAKALAVIEALTSVIVEKLADGVEVKIHQFGNIRISELKARKGKNPRTGETIDIAAVKRAHLTFSRCVKHAVRTGEVLARAIRDVSKGTLRSRQAPSNSAMSSYTSKVRNKVVELSESTKTATGKKPKPSIIPKKRTPVAGFRPTSKISSDEI